MNSFIKFLEVNNLRMNRILLVNFVAFLVYDRQILDTNMGESLLEHSTAQEILNGDRHGWSFWDHEAFGEIDFIASVLLAYLLVYLSERVLNIK